MRIELKVVGVAIALCGAFFLSIFPSMLGNAIRTPDNGAVVFSLILAVLGVGFIFAGRYYFQLNPDAKDAPRPGSKLSHFLVDHRRDLKVLAQAGVVLSLIRLIEACFGSDWPTRWITYVLVIGAFTVHDCGKKAANPAVIDNSDWMTVPARIRHVFEQAEKAVGALMLGFALLALLTLFNHSDGVSHLAGFVARFIADAMAMIIYGRAALFFAYGELRPSTAEPP
jgi:hypothetical protein